jgi:large subunit ribosomal protein L15
MPLFRRIPKRGFNNSVFRKEYTEVKLSDLEGFENGTEVTAELLKQNGIISKINDGIVVLGNGNLTKKLTVKAARFTKTASEKIEALGGKAEVI